MNGTASSRIYDWLIDLLPEDEKMMLDWTKMSAAGQRLWAIDKLAPYRELITTYEDRPSTEELFAKADLLVDYITNGRRAGGSVSQSPASPCPQDSKDTPVPLPLEAI